MKPHILIFVATCLLACNKSKNPTPAAVSTPEPLLLKVSGAQKLAGISGVEPYWFQNGIRHIENDSTAEWDELPFHVEYVNGDSLHPILVNGGMVSIAGMDGIRTLYISYAGLAIDTIQLSVRKLITPGGYTFHLDSVTQHGHALKIDSSLYPTYLYPVYELE